MKITKAQALANRVHVVETASSLFRERGYDGVGVADLMASAGFTHGGFYKQFSSKSDLMAESAVSGMMKTAALTVDMDATQFVELYLSREHRDVRATGCTMAALGGDAARQSDEIRNKFAEGIENLVTILSRKVSVDETVDLDQSRVKAIDAFAHALGAIVLSRACPDDSPLADEILTVCRNEILRSLNLLS
ncbi:TetR/AcrR family transcriptional regulator [Acinetobacter seifertii]|uniref:TetR/AcrR family transcriptional regulator n=1 Tax=Acinetobacter seifertii TaxID=1530123 RepID=UPI000D397B09|nr:TetR/AcrR family transcriptional regulator [Acinetobacter seifertii]PTV49608.1 TetR family transcriptional regulator [Acinetobacter seifertii]